jgi:hypothetical protein
VKVTSNKVLQLWCIGILAVISHIAPASLVTIPDGLAPGDSYRLVFVTGGLHDASSALITDYNSFVTSQANSAASLASLNITWSVLGSTPSVDALTNTNTDPALDGVPIYNLNGQLVASGNADLWDGSLANAINVDQNGNTLAGVVFTGTGINGLGLPSRQFGAIGYRVQTGNSGLTNSGWTTIDWFGTLAQLHFYGISDVMTVPTPEPATLLLLALGGLALTNAKRNKA